jgi:hypothetical protein
MTWSAKRRTPKGNKELIYHKPKTRKTRREKGPKIIL